MGSPFYIFVLFTSLWNRGLSVEANSIVHKGQCHFFILALQSFTAPRFGQSWLTPLECTLEFKHNIILSGLLVVQHNRHLLQSEAVFGRFLDMQALENDHIWSKQLSRCAYTIFWVRSLFWVTFHIFGKKFRSQLSSEKVIDSAAQSTSFPATLKKKEKKRRRLSMLVVWSVQYRWQTRGFVG